mmetsp:Transcript_41979/g.69348  ORF Transcript_41979/g.69348 Transcript_41979/m.69348 type:complete len:201 (+) Transcript_41979:520-1122(+)
MAGFEAYCTNFSVCSALTTRISSTTSMLLQSAPRMSITWSIRYRSPRSLATKARTASPSSSRPSSRAVWLTSTLPPPPPPSPPSSPSSSSSAAAAAARARVRSPRKAPKDRGGAGIPSPRPPPPRVSPSWKALCSTESMKLRAPRSGSPPLPARQPGKLNPPMAICGPSWSSSSDSAWVGKPVVNVGPGESLAIPEFQDS